MFKIKKRGGENVDLDLKDVSINNEIALYFILKYCSKIKSVKYKRNDNLVQ